MIKFCVVVVFVFNKLLEIVEVDVVLLQKGEVLVCIVVIGVCYIDVYILFGQDFEGVFLCILGYEGGGIVEVVGEGVIFLQVGDYVILLYIVECGKCKFCLFGKINFCQVVCVIQGKGLMFDGISCFFYKGELVFYYMGCLIFFEYIVLLEIFLVKIFKDVLLEKVCLFGCGVIIGIGVVLNIVKVEEGVIVVIFGLGGIGLVVIIGVKMVKVVCIIVVDINLGKFDIVRELGVIDFINLKDYDKLIQDVIVELIDGGVDYFFECVGNVQLMCVVLECCYKGWGELVIIGVVGVGQEISIWLF